MSLSHSIVVPQGHQLFLLFVDGGPQPPRPVTAWKLATPGEVVAEAGELCAHIDAMTRQGVLQRVVSAGGCMHSIDLRLLTVTNLSRGISSRLVPERSVASVPSRPYQYVFPRRSQRMTVAHVLAGSGRSPRIPCSSTSSMHMATIFTLLPLLLLMS